MLKKINTKQVLIVKPSNEKYEKKKKQKLNSTSIQNLIEILNLDASPLSTSIQ